MAQKKVGRIKSPKISKDPRVDTTIKNPMLEHPVWHIGSLDVEGKWGWENIEKEFFFVNILPKIKNFESMFWNEILGRKSHPIPTANLCKEAQKRLVDINLDDVEELVSLRLTGAQRIWGVRYSNILKILWWDPKHEVCPSIYS